MSPCSHLDVALGTCCASLRTLAAREAKREAPEAPPSPAAAPAAVARVALDGLPAPQSLAPRSPRVLAASKPLPPFVEDNQVRFHDLQVHRAVEALRAPSAAPSGQLLRMPELLGARGRPVGGSPRRTPYEEVMSAGRLPEPPAPEDATVALRQSCRPTQRAEALERPPMGTEGEKRPAERLVPHPRSAGGATEG